MQQSVRRKSCRGCVQAKRRCDLRVPRCRRCETRGKDCLYPRVVSGYPDHGTTLPDQEEASCPAELSLAAPASPFWDTADVAMLPFSTVEQTALSLPIDLDIYPPFSVSNQPTSTYVLPNGSNLGPAGTLTRNALQEQAEWGARRLAIQASILAETGHTCFIHRAKVAASNALQDAFSACAIHAMRNSSNSNLVRGEIARRAALMIEAVETATSQRQPTEVDMLPHTQALLIYQCIRLFSVYGICLQAQAERDAVILRSWVDKLRLQLQPIRNTATSTSTMSWDSWIEEESIRRTIVFADTLHGVHTFLKLGWDGKVECMHDVEFTAQTKLWEAESAASWRGRLTSFPSLPVNIRSYRRDLAAARPEDLDDLGVILRGMSYGLESLEEWLGGEEGLRRWGLRGDTDRYSIY